MTQPDGSSSSGLANASGQTAANLLVPGAGSLLGLVSPNTATAAGATVDDLTSQAVKAGQAAVTGLDPMAALAAGIGAMSAPAMEIGKVGDWLFKLSLPTTWIRVCAWVAAVFFLFFGIVLLTREMRAK